MQRSDTIYLAIAIGMLFAALSAEAQTEKVRSAPSDVELSLCHGLHDPSPTTKTASALPFHALTGIDSGHVLASRAYSAVEEPGSGESLTAGELLLGWLDDGEVEITWGGFLLRTAPDGGFLNGRYFGQLPPGPPPTDSIDCPAFCAALAESGFPHYGLRHITWEPDGDVVVSGWRRPGVGEGAESRDKDLFVAAVDASLGSELWRLAESQWGDAEVLAVTAASSQQGFLTGFFGVDQSDFLVGRYRVENGVASLDRVRSARGPFDDAGHRIALAGSAVELRGTFTHRLAFADRSLRSGDNAPAEFVARYSTDLRLLHAETVLPPRPENDEDGEGGPVLGEAALTGLQIASGQWGGGWIEQLSASDDSYVHLYGVHGGGLETAVLVADLQWAPETQALDSIDLEIQSDACAVVTVLLGGGLAGDFLDVASASVCALEEALLTLPVPPAISDQLGVDLPSVAAGDLPVRLAIVFRFYPLPCETGLCLTTIKDAKIDQVTVKTDYDR